MKRLKSISEFKFNFAEYNVMDASKNSGSLYVDYSNNTFFIRGNIDEEAKKELSHFAISLLKRKRGKNFAKLNSKVKNFSK